MYKVISALVATALLAFSGSLSAGVISGTVLTNWNVDELNDSGDYVEAHWWQEGDNTAVSFSWFDNSTTTPHPSALGIDQIYYNFDPTLVANGTGMVTSVFMNTADSLLGAIDVTADWQLSNGNINGGGGFGDFESKNNKEPGGRSGIDPDKVIFLLSGTVDFLSNSDTGAMFDVHVRYNNECSGWASDGRLGAGGTYSDAGCGGSTTVPEPNVLFLLMAGLLGFVTVRMRRPF